jgi:hypothetical protein
LKEEAGEGRKILQKKVEQEKQEREEKLIEIHK